MFSESKTKKSSVADGFQITVPTSKNGLILSAIPSGVDDRAQFNLGLIVKLLLHT